jgi:hypothetical protein
MPIPNTYKEIIEMLDAATQGGRVRWKKSNTAGTTVSVSVPPSLFEIWAGIDDQNDRAFVAFGIREGRSLVDNWFIEEGDAEYKLMSELYQSAKRQAFGVTEKLQGLKDLLGKQGPVGE